uniref:Uncharacterized protein LOC113786557 n=1 Tax=Cicer arietinum TaxID=3827 RepID=A0A3Q7XZQ9_CICAR
MSKAKYIIEEGSSNRPPYFDGTSYYLWKGKMQLFLKSQDIGLWCIITHRNFTPNVDESDPTSDKKKEADWTIEDKAQMWYLDSGCSKHMTGDITKFSALTLESKGHVVYGDNNKGKILGIGKVGTAPSPSIEDVLYVEGLKHNLISISQLCDKGYKIVFNKDECVIQNEATNETQFVGKRFKNIFILNFEDLSLKMKCLLVSDNNDAWLWHKRFAHIHMDHLNKLVKHDLVVGLPKIKFIKDKLCDACQKGKQTKSSFKPKNVISTSRPLQLIHMDLFGPSRTKSLGGNSYGLVIVDDYSRFTWTLFLANKNEAFKAFKNYAKLVQNEQSAKIVSIRSDHGREFQNTSFEEFCEENGIFHNFSAPRTPQQNGVVERKNRSLIELARTMLSDSNLPKYFWADAVNTACYVSNRVIIRPILKKTPYELYKGRKPNISHFHIFGCKCFVLNNGKDNLGKFDEKADEGIFLGYSLSSKAFRVFNKRTLLVEESMHVTFDAIRLLLAYACSMNFELYQMDVKSAFLNGYINEEVYVKQPPGFEDSKNPSHVYKLKKALYGLKQAPRAWYDRLSTFLCERGFDKGEVDKTLFVKRENGHTLLVQIYVDDIIFGSTNKDICEEFSLIMQGEFEMSMMGKLNYFLGVHIKQLEHGIFINQAKYCKELLKKFEIENCKESTTPMGSGTYVDKDASGISIDISKYRGMIGSLLYLTASRPNIMFSVCLCARFQADPKESHLVAVKRIMKYLKGTTNVGLWYPKGSICSLVGYSDSDYAGCKTDRKSTSGTCHVLGNALVSWSCKKQACVALSTAEAEYIAAGSCCAQILWLKQQLHDYGVDLGCIPLRCDNTSAINISKNPIMHSRTKHIDIRHHFLRDHVLKGNVEVTFVDTHNQLADIFTKPLPKDSFYKIRRELG